jgi:hypothetical protein
MNANVGLRRPRQHTGPVLALYHLCNVMLALAGNLSNTLHGLAPALPVLPVQRIGHAVGPENIQKL